jgi:hypothetical protein
MNPVAIESLNQAEKQNRARQVRALQLLNQAQAASPGRPHLLAALMSRLGALLVAASQRLEERDISAGRRVRGEAQ